MSTNTRVGCSVAALEGDGRQVACHRGRIGDHTDQSHLRGRGYRALRDTDSRSSPFSRWRVRTAPHRSLIGWAVFACVVIIATGCLFANGGCAVTVSETAGDKSIRGLSIEVTGSDRMERAAANALDPLAREQLGLEWQTAILEYYSEVSAEWEVDDAIRALQTARGMVLFEAVEDEADEGTSEEVEPSEPRRYRLGPG